MEPKQTTLPLFRLLVTLCAVTTVSTAGYVNPGFLIRNEAAERQQSTKRMDRNMLLMGLGKRNGIDKHVLFQGLGKRNDVYLEDLQTNPYSFSKRRMSRGMLLAGIGKRMDRNMLFTGIGKRPMDREMVIQGLGRRADPDFLLSNLDDGGALRLNRRQDPNMLLMGLGKRDGYYYSDRPYIIVPKEDEFDTNSNYGEDSFPDFDPQDRNLDSALRFGGLGKKRKRRSASVDIPAVEKAKRSTAGNSVQSADEDDASERQITARKRGIDRSMLFSGMGKRDFATKRGMDKSMLFSGFGKRGFDRSMLFSGMGKRSDPKRVMDSQMLLAGLGKRPHDEDEDEDKDEDHTAIFDQLAAAMDRPRNNSNNENDYFIGRGDDVDRARSILPGYLYNDDNDMKEKRYSNKMLLTGLGRRQDGENDAQEAAIPAADDEKRGLDRTMLFSGMGKRRLSKMLLTGLGKRRLDSSMLFSGLGKRGYSKMLLTGLGKRRLDSSMLYTGLGKRRMDSSMLFSGLGKRRLSKQMLLSGLGRRESQQVDKDSTSNRLSMDTSDILSEKRKRTVS